MRRPSQTGFLRGVELREDVAIPDEAYYRAIPAVRALGALALHDRVTFLVGENGSGKSTLLEAIAVAAGFNPEGGTRNFRFATRETQSSLGSFLRLVRNARPLRDGFFLRAESFYYVASAIDEYGAQGSYGGRSLHAMSHGESFLELATTRFEEGGLFLLDEPEAALSASRQLSFLTVLHRLARGGSQLLIATHSPILTAYPDAIIYELGPNGIRRVKYEDTANYEVTKGFLAAPERYLRHLLAGEEDG